MKAKALLVVILILAVFVLQGLSAPIGLAQSSSLTEVTTLRTRASKTYLTESSTYSYMTTGEPLHYQVNGTWQNIDNSWIPATAPWNWKMVSDSYQAYALSNLAAGQSLMFTYNGSSVAYQPMALEWTNNLSQVSQISMPQGVPITVNNTLQEPMPNTSTYTGVVRWDDAYGEGRHFEWSANPGKLKETIQLDSLLPAPPQYIIDGGSPVLRHNFIFSPSSDLEIWVNGALWDKKASVATVNSIEFKKSGVVLWIFEPVYYWDSNFTNPLKPPIHRVGITELRKSGNNLYISTRIPYSWLQTAVYPVFIDPSKTFQPDSAGEDNYLDSEASTTNYGTSDTVMVGYSDFDPIARYRGLLEFTVNWTTDFPATYTILSSTFSLYVYSMGTTQTYYAQRLIRLDWVESQSTWSIYKTGSSWTTAGCGSPDNDYSTTDQVTISITSTGWKDWTVTNQVLTAKTGNYNVGFRVADIGGTAFHLINAYSSDYGTASLRPKLVVTYAVPSTLTTSAATNVAATTATLNGDVTDTGGADPTVTMYWGDNDGGTTPGNWDNGVAPTSPAQPQGVAAFYYNVAGLNASTLYYFTAKGVNTAGTSWATTKNFTTGSACSANVTTTPATWSVNGGVAIVVNTNYTSGLTYFNSTNNSGGAVTITIYGTDMTGGNSWDLADDGQADSMTYGLYAGLSGGDYTIIVKEQGSTPYNTLKASLANGASQLWGLKLWAPTVYTDGSSKTSYVTLAVVCD